MSATEKQKELQDSFRKMLNDAGGLEEQFDNLYNKTFSDGALDTKTKRLMGLAGALIYGCEGCILGQTKRSIEAGATRRELAETYAVALAIGGTMAASKSSLVYQMMDEKSIT